MAEDILSGPNDVDGSAGNPVTEASVTNLSADLAAASFNPFDYQRTAGTLRETFPRLWVQNTFQPNSGVLYLTLLPLLAGDVVTSLRFYTNAGGGSTGLTHSWACLIDSSTNVLRKSTDNTAEWTAGTSRTFTLTASYTVLSTGIFYAGVCLTRTTTSPSLLAANPIVSTATSLSPNVSKSDLTGYTTPASLGSTTPASVGGVPTYIEVL